MINPNQMNQVKCVACLENEPTEEDIDEIFSHLEKNKIEVTKNTLFTWVQIQHQYIIKENIKMATGIITQICLTIQGEGPTAGTPVLLVRLGNCNLNCSYCDTKWSKNLRHPDMPSYISYNKDIPVVYPLSIESDDLEIFCEYFVAQHMKDYKIETVLITGGEPFINPEFLTELCDSLLIYTPIKYIEIETNGTLISEYDYPIQLNISPKLNPNFYLTEQITSLVDIIDLFKKKLEKISTSHNTIIFKFVYDKEFLSNIEQFINALDIRETYPIYIMPLTPEHTKYDSESEFLEAFRKSSYETLDYCLKNGYVFSSRQHVWLFNNFTNRNEFEDVVKQEK